MVLFWTPCGHAYALGMSRRAILPPAMNTPAKVQPPPVPDDADGIDLPPEGLRAPPETSGITVESEYGAPRTTGGRRAQSMEAIKRYRSRGDIRRSGL